MKSIITLLLLLSNFLSNSQEKQIYVLFERIDSDIIYNEELIASKNSALFWNEEISKRGGIETTKVNDGTYNFKDRNIHLFKKEITLNNTNAINILVYDTENFVNVIDSLPNFNWIIHDNVTKKIGDYECIKATCNFRGTNIIAYFTPEIPIPFGPWKFKDLPGLILEINTDDYLTQISWKATKIIYPYENNRIKKDNVPSKKITLKEDVLNDELNFKKLIELDKARMPEGTILTEVKRVRMGIEKKYEWEE